MPVQTGTASFMSVILVISPHLDDAAFSVGPLLAEFADRAKIVVATVFTKSELNPAGFALTCQLDKGLSAGADYMAIRRTEDIEWSKKIGAEVVHGAFAEAPHRGYHSPKELFSPALPNDELEDVLTNWFLELAKTFKPGAILCPVGVGNHVDHILVRKFARTSLESKFPLFFFKDQPYASKLNTFHVADYLGDVNAWRELRMPLSENSLAKAQFAVEAYKTQIPFQFGDLGKMRNTLNEVWMQTSSLFYIHEKTDVSDVFPLIKFDQICPV